MSLPTDSHVHTEFSWDAPDGSMERTCERAVEIGLPAVAFTEHVDHTAWRLPPEVDDAHLRSLADEDGLVVPPGFDAAAYLERVERCRDRFPDLRILTGLELGEPHWYADQVADLLAEGTFDRVLGSLHALPDGKGYAEPPGLFAHRDSHEVMRSYLTEVAELAANCDAFEVLAHIDYPVRYWPNETAGPFDASAFEDEFRHALLMAAETGLTLELNTVVPLDGRILAWWRDVGGRTITFASDAHRPESLARRFAEAIDLAEAHGFRGGEHPYDDWRC